MTASINIDVLAIIALSFTIYLAKRNIIVSKYKNMIYISASAITIGILLLEIATVIMEQSNNINLVIPYRITNVIGFSLCPVVPLILLFLNNNMERKGSYNSLLALPLYFNAFLSVLSYKTGWIFFVDSQNHYARGKFFLIPTAISIFYFVLVALAIMRNTDEYENNDKVLIFSILFMPILGTMIQILYRDVLVIWGGVSISLILYYILFRELQFNYDIQTGMRNRSAFEGEMLQYLKHNENAVLVIADVNNLKTINDSYGHRAGDEAIYYVAKIIQESFLNIGKAFRIGGDEFCIICRDISKETLDKALVNLEHLLSTINRNRSNKIVLAYGYSFYTNSGNENIYSTFTQADEAMYLHKVKLKGSDGSRKDCQYYFVERDPL